MLVFYKNVSEKLKIYATTETIATAFNNGAYYPLDGLNGLVNQ